MFEKILKVLLPCRVGVPIQGFATRVGGERRKKEGGTPFRGDPPSFFEPTRLAPGNLPRGIEARSYGVLCVFTGRKPYI